MAYVDFDCGVTFYPETPTKTRQINRERNYISRSCEKPKYLPSNDQHNCSFDQQYSSNISPNPYSFWEMVPAAMYEDKTYLNIVMKLGTAQQCNKIGYTSTMC